MPDGTKIFPSLAGGADYIASWTDKRLEVRKVEDVAEVTDITCVGGDVLNNNDYFLINAPEGGFYVWFDKDNRGVDPALPNKTGLEIDFTETDDADAIAGKVQAAINGEAEFGATVTDNVVTVTCASDGAVNPPVDYNSQCTFEITTKGGNTVEKFNDIVYEDADILNVELASDGSAKLLVSETSEIVYNLGDIVKTVSTDVVGFREQTAGWITL